jgi:hypothetical protein
MGLRSGDVLPLVVVQVVHEPVALVPGTDLDRLEDQGVRDGDALVGRHEYS